MDIKVMPEAMGYKYILVFVDENTHYLTCFPLKDCKAITIANIILNEICLRSGNPRRFITDLAHLFASEILNYLAKALGFQLIFISAGNHHQNRTERYISSLQSSLIMHLKSRANLWPCFLAPAVFSLNAFTSPALENYSPYELHFKSGPVLLNRYQLSPLTGICKSIQEYVGAVKQKFELIQEMLNTKHKTKQLKQYTQSVRGSNEMKIQEDDLVYLLMPDASRLRDTRSKKIVLNWTGPLIVYKKDGHGNAILQRLDGKLLCNVISMRRLKPAYIRTSEGELLTKKKDIMAQIKNKPDAFTRELEKGLLPDYLQFEDNTGTQHETTETLMVMNNPTERSENTQADDSGSQHSDLKDNLPERPQTSRARIHKHLENGEYDIIKGRFKDGVLQYLIKRTNGTNDQSLYVNCTEGLKCLNMISEDIYSTMRITGGPLIPFVTKNI
jgi:hypothetical protein